MTSSKPRNYLLLMLLLCVIVLSALLIRQHVQSTFDENVVGTYRYVSGTAVSIKPTYLTLGRDADYVLYAVNDDNYNLPADSGKYEAIDDAILFSDSASGNSYRVLHERDYLIVPFADGVLLFQKQTRHPTYFTYSE